MVGADRFGGDEGGEGGGQADGGDTRKQGDGAVWAGWEGGARRRRARGGGKRGRRGRRGESYALTEPDSGRREPSGPGVGGLDGVGVGVARSPGYYYCSFFGGREIRLYTSVLYFLSEGGMATNGWGVEARRPCGGYHSAPEFSVSVKECGADVAEGEQVSHLSPPPQVSLGPSVPVLCSVPRCRLVTSDLLSPRKRMEEMDFFMSDL
ncbi:unnamed protein product [Boreogadus saida]